MGVSRMFRVSFAFASLNGSTALHSGWGISLRKAKSGDPESSFSAVMTVAGNKLPPRGRQIGSVPCRR